MLDVLIALLPCLICGVVYFGLYALMLVAVCMAVCFASEQIYNLIRKKPFTSDLSALVTGLILGLNLPPRAPWYIPVIGGVFAIVIVKMLFGGLGRNFANPAAAARVFLLLAYSTSMTTFIGADAAGNILSADGSTGATYLGGGTSVLAGSFFGVQGYWGNVLQLFFGSIGGSIGETCKLAVLAGGVYLIARRVIDWRIPVVYLLTAAMMALFCWNSAKEVLLQLFSGGLMFGAFFMATDYATSPKWKYNKILYAFGLGVVTMIIRCFGTYPEGTSLAVLFMNLLVPAMDRFLLPVRFGQLTGRGKPKPHVMKWSMRGLCIALAAAIAVGTPVIAAAEYKRPVELELPAEYRYIQSMSRDRNGNYYFDVQGGAAITEDYTQQLEYRVTVDTQNGIIGSIEPVRQSTMGYTAELSLFVGKTYAQVAALEDLSSDSATSATLTNTALKGMVLECFIAADLSREAIGLAASYNYIKGAAESAIFEGRAYLTAGAADLTEYDYRQALLYYIVINGGRVAEIVPLVQSTMGYTAELSLFTGKTYAEVAALGDLSADADTSATRTNSALKEMVLECLLDSDIAQNGRVLPAGLAYVKAAGSSSAFGGMSFIAEGYADLYEYNYRQPLLFYVNIKDGSVADIIPIRQSTMGYTAELSLFIGRTRTDIEMLSDLFTDADTSATRTNTALRAMLLECFDVYGGEA